MAWEYKRTEDNSYKPLPIGDYRIRIAKAEKKTSSKGNEMLSLQFDVSGHAGYLFHNITFLKDRPEITNSQLTKFFDSFAGIPEGDFDTSHWIGKVGACHVKHEEYNGEQQAKVHYFISKARAESLPAWSEPDRKSSAKTDDVTVNVPDGVDEEVPFG